MGTGEKKNFGTTHSPTLNRIATNSRWGGNSQEVEVEEINLYNRKKI